MTDCVAGSPAVDPALVARFSAALERLNPDGGKIGLAVSGGPDSMAMLLLAQEAIPGGFEVATVDHGLRPEAKDECALVVAACKERGVPCEVLEVQVGDGNVQAKAREARYAALEGWAARREIAAYATAHHANDQAETFMMRLMRGVGVTGLAGIRERLVPVDADSPALIRPLLDFTREELLEVVRSSEQTSVDDPSNANQEFERVRMRQALAAADWIDVRMAARSARHLAEADDALWWASDIAWANNASIEDDGTIRVAPLGPRVIRLHLLGQAIFELGGKSEGGDLARLLERLERGENGNLGRVLAIVEGDEWVFRPEPPRRTG